MEKCNQTIRWVLVMVAMAAWTMWGGSRAALGQYRVENYDGHLLDASTRIGSGGYNNAAAPNNSINAQQLYLGNVTGYGAFSGTVPDRDPAGFQGFIPYQPSLILDQQSGVSSPTAAPTYGKAQPYYNQYNVASSPIPVQQIPGTISYLPATPAYQANQDYRLGSTLNTPTATLPKLGEIVGPGAVDPTASMTPSFLNGAPLAGLSALNQPASYGATYIQPGTSGLGVTPAQSANSALVSGLSQRDLDRLRGELAQSKLSPAAQAQLGSGAIANLVGNNPSPNGVTPGSITPGAPAPAGTPAPPGTPVSSEIAQARVEAGISVPQSAAAQNAAVAPGANNFSTGQAERTSMALPPPPAEQSQQYAKLRDLLNQYQASHPKTDEEANRQFQAALKARRDYEQSLAHPAPAAKPAENATPQPTLGNPPETAPPPPLPVGPIGSSIRAPLLSQLLQQAEDLSVHQRYKEAISKFLDARQVAPNETLIEVDLANAELGAGFYAEAEQSLRDAFTADPATQMGKFDLWSEINDERLQVLIADLKQLAKNGDSATPVFLLAYLSYNMGDTDKAVGYLHLAESRAGGTDDLIRSLGEHWTLPASQPSK